MEVLAVVVSGVVMRYQDLAAMNVDMRSGGGRVALLDRTARQHGCRRDTLHGNRGQQ